MKKILIVEDEVALRDVYVMLFKSQKFEVHEAPNGQIAISKLKDADPDVIILDILMPVMGGIEFLETTKIKETFPKTRVLVLSNLSDPKTLARIKELGADHYILKASASPTKLLGSVHELLNS
jgi:CheY-like chemotaxis protein